MTQLMRSLLSIPAMLLCGSLCAAQIKELNQITIVSRWGGLGQPQRSELTIARKSAGYYVNSQKVKEQQIRDLITALNEPVVEKLELSNLGITQEWLDANAAPGMEDYGLMDFSTAAPNQRELYFSSFKNLKYIGDGLPDLFHSGWTDDYPGVQIVLTTADGGITTLSSHVQSLFMLPWHLEHNGQTTDTYNAHLSRAIAALLPEKFANRERIAGEGLRRTLAEYVMRWIDDDWKRLEAENKVGGDLAHLRSKYSITSVDINGYHNVDYGKEMIRGNYTEVNLHATLRKPEFPEGFSISAVLPYENKSVENVDLFLNNIERYQELFTRVSWLSDYVATHPTANVRLRFVTNRSFSARAARIFDEDMKRLGKSNLAAEVAAAQKDVSLILVGRDYYQAYWLILPDKRMVLWRFRGYDALLKWKADDFTIADCKEFQSKCVGAIISADGTIDSK